MRRLSPPLRSGLAAMRISFYWAFSEPRRVYETFSVAATVKCCKEAAAVSSSPSLPY